MNDTQQNHAVVSQDCLTPLYFNGSQCFPGPRSAQVFANPPLRAQMTPFSTIFWGPTDVWNHGHSFYSGPLSFRSSTPPQSPMSQARIETSARPSYFSIEPTISHGLNQDLINYAPFISPVQGIRSQPSPDFSYRSQQLDSPMYVSLSNISISLTYKTSFKATQATQPSQQLAVKDFEEPKTLEEYCPKTARSHSLYSLYLRKPDAAGFYHCPGEGDRDCNHKPTLRKSRY